MTSTRNLRILYVINQLAVGGTELFLLRKMKKLKERGHFVALAYVEERGEAIHTYLEQFIAKDDLYRVTYEFDDISKLIDELKINIVHTVQGHPFFLRSSSKMQNPPLRFSTITANVWEADKKFDHEKFTDVIITKSEGFLDIIQERISKPAKTLKAIQNGVDLEEFVPWIPNPSQRSELLKELKLPDNAKVILHLSRIVPFKNIQASMNIAKRMTRNDPDLFFIHIGACPPKHEDYLKTLLKKQEEDELKGRFIFLGEKTDIKKYLALSELVLLTTRSHEGTPNALLEALACAKPVVSFDCIGISDVVRDGITGYRVPVHDVEEAIIRIKTLLNSKVLHRAMGIAARKYAESNFDINTAVSQYEELYQESLKFA